MEFTVNIDNEKIEEIINKNMISDEEIAKILLIAISKYFESENGRNTIEKILINRSSSYYDANINLTYTGERIVKSIINNDKDIEALKIKVFDLFDNNIQKIVSEALAIAISNVLFSKVDLNYIFNDAKFTAAVSNIVSQKLDEKERNS